MVNINQPIFRHQANVYYRLMHTNPTVYRLYALFPEKTEGEMQLEVVRGADLILEHEGFILKIFKFSVKMNDAK
jgi:hypothetical protein